MNNINDDVTSNVLKLTREVINLLQSNEPVEKILEKMNERDNYVSQMQDKQDINSDSNAILELIRLHNDEKELIKPYINEFHDVRQAIINLKSARCYLSSDL